MINIGQSIKEELKRQDRTISWLARKLNCHRSVVYRLLDKNSIDSAMLKNISVILNHNFFKELSEEIERSRTY